MPTKPVLILYATSEGQTRRIAEHLGATLRARGSTVDVIDVAEIGTDFSLDRYSAAVLAASVRIGKHPKGMVEFVKRHLEELERIPATFISVSLSEAGAEDTKRTPEDRARFAADAQGMIEAFLAETGWHPSKVHAAAGALMYSKYNFLIRFVMRRIARSVGVSTDTSHDYEFTDWAALDHIADEVVKTSVQHD